MIFTSAFLVALIVSALLSWACIRWATRLGFVDKPGSETHKQHRRVIPYGGGVAMAIGAACAIITVRLLGMHDVWLMKGFVEPDLLPVAIGCLGLMVIGVWDDAKAMRARWKLLAQFVVVTAATLSCDSIRHGGPMMWIIVPCIIVWCTMLSNAYNLMDHADGLSSSIALVGATVLFIHALGTGDTYLAVIWLITLGSVGGFWLWNRPPARIYMGDGGSLPLGFLMAWGGLSMVPDLLRSGVPHPIAVESHLLPYAAPILISAIPLYDMTVVLIKRWRRGKALFKGDRGHLSHRLTRLGLAPWFGLSAAIAMQTALALGALIVVRSSWQIGLIVCAQALAISLVAIFLEATRDHEM